jgi:hypothetical protein
MTSIYTHMPLGTEYVRAILFFDEEGDGSIKGYQVFPLNPLLLPTTDYQRILDTCYKRVEKEFNVHNPALAENTLNLNEEFAKIHEEGKVKFTKHYQTTTHCGQNEQGIVYPKSLERTNDGCVVFHHGPLPPAYTNLYH